MTEKPDKPVHWGNTDFGQSLGLACLLLALLLGMGGCFALGGSLRLKFKDDTSEINTTKP